MESRLRFVQLMRLIRTPEDNAITHPAPHNRSSLTIVLCCKLEHAVWRFESIFLSIRSVKKAAFRFFSLSAEISCLFKAATHCKLVGN